MSNFPSFVHLRLHTEYSLSNGTIRVKSLVKAVIAGRMPACAVTDQTNLFAVVKFYRAATQAGIKPIVGVDFQVLDAAAGPANPSANPPSSQLVLLAQNEEGYRNLCRLVSRCYQEGQDSGSARLYRHWLNPDSTTGLIALSGGRQGEIGQALLTGKPEAAAESWAYWNALFPQRFYLELQRTGRAQEENYIQAAVQLAVQYQIPVVATNAVHFLKPDDFEAHEARVCIQDGAILSDPRRARLFSEQQYLRSAAEMAELFADIPEALANTVEIAKRCNLRLQLGKNYLPDFPVPAGQTVASFFRQQSEQGLAQRLNQLFPEESLREHKRPQYFERLQFELEVIIAMGFPGYFLIVADFIRWAKANGVPVGPGRGSGAGSLVAYALQITDLDPLAYDLLFERFLNPERVSLPDFDVDFCMEGRDRVIEYVSAHYGRERVSQIITYGSMKAKAVIRDVGRVLGHSYPFVDKLAKLIPFDLDMTLEKALAEEEILQQRYQQEEEVKILFDLARSLEGIARNAGRHAGGVVIAPSVLTDFSPLYCERGGGGLATQFDKDDVEAVGLVKFDFLGLRTLTIIDWAVKTINRQQAPARLDITTLPMDDPASFALLKRCETTAVFQLESRGMKDLIKRLQPDCFEDIIALVALFRPGPLQSGMVDDFINRKHGRAKVEYPHPDLEPILKPTYGVILYQEQVMQIAQVLAGYTLGGADMLRRAMGKKKAEEMAKQRNTFLEGATQRGVAAEVAGAIFDLMEKFAGYGFNKTLHKNTEIYTLKGIKKIKDCKAGDQVVSIAVDGSYACTEVIALHDHGQIPLWEIQFDDETIERCTLDHKWLTENGQQPLWKIIQMGSQVWGSPAYQADSFRTTFANGAGTGSDAEPRNYETILALNPAFDGMLQKQLWRAYFARIGPVNSDHRQWRLGRDTVLRKPVRAMFVGWSQGYDLEVAHPEHNFLLASGLCCSNSHSAAYALLSYQTAWLKAHYPAAFMAAVLSADCDNTDKVVILIEECRAMKLTVQPPNINRSDYAFTVAANQDILYGLGAIKGVGSAALDGILHSVKTQGAYQSLFDLCCRVDLGKVNRRVLESLIRAGALDELGRHRASLLHHLPEVVQMAEQAANNQAAGMMDLFGGAELQNEVPSERPVAEWPEIERLKAEKAALGLYLTGHPITEHEAELSHFISARLNALEPLLPTSASGAVYGNTTGRRYNSRETKVVIAGLVVELRIKPTARGKMVFVVLDDRAGRVEVVVYGEIYEQYRDYLLEDQLLVIKGSLSTNDFSGGVKISADVIYTIEQARAQFAKSILLTVSSPPANPQWVAALAKILSAFRLGGTCPLWIDYQNSSASARLILGSDWRVQPQDELIRQLRQWGGESQVVLVYH